MGQNKKRACLAKSVPLLRALRCMSVKDVEGTLELLNDQGLEAVYQCINNCVYNCKLPKKHQCSIKEALANTSEVYEYLANPRKCRKRKRKLLKQVGGGGLPLIITTALPLLEDIVGVAPSQ